MLEKNSSVIVEFLVMLSAFKLFHSDRLFLR